MAGGRRWLRKAAILLALGAGTLARSAAAPEPKTATAPAWTADPDEQFILDVTIRQLRLGDTVRAYNAPEGTCVVLGDFLTALDVPIRIDLKARTAVGWAFKENNRISIDYAAHRVTYGAKGATETMAAGAVRETPDGWCVQTSALSRWFGIGVKPVTSGSVLMLSSDEKLPVELEMERQKRAARIHQGSFSLASLPQVRVPYRMWRAPALDFVVSGGVTYRAHDGVKVDREASVYAAGEVARMSYDAQVTTTSTGKPDLLRVRAFRSDPDGNLLGPLHATHFGVGDVEGFDTTLTGSLAAGRGFVVTNRPLTAKTDFDHTRVEGDLPSGWEAELYRNGELLAFAKSDGTQRYVFDNVQLLYGENRIRVVLYGPQGQVRTRDETYNVGQEDVPKGKTWYWIGANQPGRDLITLEKPPDELSLPKAQAAVSVEHGLDARTSVGVLARAMLIGDERLTFVEGTVRRSVGGALIAVSAARESNGGTAARAQVTGKIGPVYVNVDALIANDFHLQDGPAISSREVRLSLDTPLKIGKSSIPAHIEAHVANRSDGSRLVEGMARLSASVDRFNLGTQVSYTKTTVPTGESAPAELTVGALGSGHIGPVRLRASADFDIKPSARFKDAELSAYWSSSDRSSWEAVLTRDPIAHRTLGRLSHIVWYKTMAVAVTGEAATNGDLALGFNLNFSLDARHGVTMSRQPLAQGGMVHAIVYRDLNDNGVRDPGEPLEKGALITTGSRQSESKTDARGSAVIGGLTAYVPVPVGIDTTGLDDPMLTPKKALQVVVPRPGIAADVEIGLVGGGDVEGALIKSGELGFEGVDLELVDRTGNVVGSARTDFDGFFLFERVPYGHYVLRVSAAAASAAKIAENLGVSLDITPEKPVIRLGTLRPVRPQQIAAAPEAAPAHPKSK